MAETPDDDDVKRVINNYVDPDSTQEGELEDDLDDAGFTQSAIDAFADNAITVEEAAETVEKERGASPGLTTREQVEDSVSGIDKPGSDSRQAAISREISRDLGAPTEAEADRARSQAAQFVDEDGMLRSNADLDPLADGGEGREIIDLNEASLGAGDNLGGGNDLQEGVERSGSDSGTFYLEDSGGNRYPIAEVDL